VYTTIHRIKGVPRPVDAEAAVGRELALTLSQQAGFIAYLLVDLGGGSYASVCLFDDAASLRQARRATRAAVAEELGALLPVGRATTEGEVIVQKGL
jgi:hypothetical protein